MKVLRHIFRFHGFRESFKLAAKGVAYLFMYHRNMRIIFLIGLGALLLGIYFKLKGIELVALCITVTLVFVAEIFNTAIEMIIDMFTDKYHTLIKLVKDIAAAVVLVASLNAVAVSFIIFYPRTAALLSISFTEGAQNNKLHKELRTSVGKELAITLESNKTTGFQWQLAEPPDRKVLEFVRAEYMSENANLVGAGGKEIWIFKAVACGKAIVSLEYARPWEKDIPPIKKEVFVVTVNK